MGKRKIIEVDEDKCVGCGDCIPACPEGALQIIDGKARLVSDLFCDGLGACVGECPTGAMQVVEREAEEYDERKVMENIIPKGENTIRAHLKHLRDHGATDFLEEAMNVLKDKDINIDLEKKTESACAGGGCPGARMMDLRNRPRASTYQSQESQLRQWPVQFHLVPPTAPYFNEADILVTADCVPFAYADYRGDLLKGKAVVVGCPKLDDISAYKDKMTEIIRHNNPKSITVAIMEVPCCGGMYFAVNEAAKAAGFKGKVEKVVIGVDGNKR